MFLPQGFHRPLLSIGSLHSLAPSLHYSIVYIILSKQSSLVNPQFKQNETWIFAISTLVTTSLWVYNGSISSGDSITNTISRLK